MMLSVIYLASSSRQKEEIHHNELVKYFQWQPQQDILYFSDHIPYGTAVKKNDKCLECSLLFPLVHHDYYFIFLS